ncbi:T9SS type A sorting domain-containing protein [Hyunsoonleella pacifica]|uniref:T9SS type A sorting domain-containing protein n=3 Tax=Hyunsoonleella pacifica TaxID=1080224 RepID=A0A4Q9FK10_9FLAO|nr:T9SS type A sorting domain-containing protein [Hyunsoonleella pacifica]
MVEACTADAGTLTADADTVTLTGDSVTINATPDGNIVVPDYYSQIFVLTSGDNLVIEAVDSAPSFAVTAPGKYTIHTLVYDGRPDSANFLNLGIVNFGETTGGDVLEVVMYNSLCASLDVSGAMITVIAPEECTANAGTLAANATEVCSTGEVVISAQPNGDANVPQDYSVLYVLTEGNELIIRQIADTPEFTISGGGNYTIHTFVYPTDLDLSGVVPNVTTGFDVNGLLIQGGGELCASLDVAGASVSIINPDAGTLTAASNAVTLSGGSAILSATPNGDANVPAGYSVLYFLTQGNELLIRQVGGAPEFTVNEAGNYTIHTLVYPTDLDLGGVVPNETTGFDVNGLLIQGGGSLCASLDVTGAPVMVENEEEICEASSGKMYSPKPIQCLDRNGATIAAKFYQQPNVPEGYAQLYVLTEAFSLTILQVSELPEFTVDHQGFYRIHSLVYNPNTLDLSIVQLGKTTGFDVVNLVTENNICASLDVRGAINLVIGSKWFCYFFNKYRASHWNNRNGKGPNDNDLAAYIDTYNSYEEFEASFVDQNDEVRFYPNPVVNNLNVEIRLFDNEEMSYSIMDVRGRMIMSGSAEALKSGKFTINTNRFAKGMYVVNFVSEFRTVTKKIIIEK